MLTGEIEGERRTAVWGGLANDEFAKYTILEDGSPTFYAEDPIGKLVDEDQTYIAGDTFYLDVHTSEPFEAAVAAIAAETAALLQALPPRKVPPKSVPPMRVPCVCAMATPGWC